MNAPVAPIDPVGTALAATILTVVATPVLSLLVLWRFRLAVKRSMHATAPDTAPRRTTHGAAPSVRQQPTPSSPNPLLTPGATQPTPVSRLAVQRLRGAVGWYLAAGAAYALTASLTLLTLDGQELLLLRTAAVAFVFAWPLVPTLALVRAWPWPRTATVTTVYLAGLLGLGTLSEGGPLGPLTVWALFMLPASLIVASVAARPLRAVGPFIAPAVFVVGVGVMIWPWIALPIQEAGASYAMSVSAAVALIGLAAAAALLSVPIAAWRHRRKAVSGQSALIDRWWLLFALDQCLLSAGRGWPALFMLLPYLAYAAVVRVGRLRAHREAAGRRPTRLLLLRVFGARGRSQRLFREVGACWRHVGSVELIAGPDLASEALEPDEFLDLARGVLSRQFVTGADDLHRRVEQLDLRPDGDGQFRVNEFFCHDDTWRPTLHALARGAEVILVDLRQLTPQNHGVAYELDQLARLGLLDRVVALVDHTTHLPFLHHVLASAGAPPWLRTVEVHGRRIGAAVLLRSLDAALVRAPVAPDRSRRPR